MGEAIAAAAPQLGITVGAATDLGDDMGGAAKSVDVIVDFSSPQATRESSSWRLRAKKPVVIGTTGHSRKEKTELLKLAARVPCVGPAISRSGSTSSSP